MRKANRIMLKAVAILLCLVIFTTCIVSSTFAKFIVTKSTKTEMTLEAYGVTLGLDVADALESACTVEEKVNGNSLTVNLTNLKFVPGDDFTDSIIFSFSGTATTRIRFNIDVDIDFDTADFTVPAGVGNLTEATCFFPLGFTRDFDAYYNGNIYDIDPEADSVVIKPWSSINYSNYISEGILHKLYSYDFMSTNWITEEDIEEDIFDLTVTGSNKDDGSKDISLEKIFEDGDDIYFNAWSWYKDGVCTDKLSVNNLKFGFYLPYDIDVSDTSIYDANLDYVQIENYLLNVLSNEESPIEMSFTISVEQVSHSYTIPPMTWTEVE